MFRDKDTIKGVLICPSNQTITEVDVVKDDDSFLDSMYRLIDCDTIDVVRDYLRPFGCSDDLWVDDEALLKSPPVQWGFSLYPRNVANPIIGNALVLGVDRTLGDCTPHTLTADIIQKIREKIEWCYLVNRK